MIKLGSTASRETLAAFKIFIESLGWGYNVLGVGESK